MTMHDPIKSPDKDEGPRSLIERASQMYDFRKALSPEAPKLPEAPVAPPAAVAMPAPAPIVPPVAPAPVVAAPVVPPVAAAPVAPRPPRGARN